MERFSLTGAIAAIAWVGLYGSLGRAEISWTTLQHTLRPPPGVQVAEAEFAFVNRGPRPVTITGVKPSCSCISTNLEKLTYAPREGGVLKMRYNGAGQSGWQLKTIEVTTDDPAAPVTVLRIDAKIVEAFTLAPRLLRWVPGAPREPQIAVWRAQPEAAIGRPTIVVTPAGFKVELLPAPNDERTISIRITPESTATKCRGLLKLEFDGPGGAPLSAQIFVMIE